MALTTRRRPYTYPSSREEAESLLTAIDLQLADLSDLRDTSKGKSVDPSNYEIAIDNYESELVAFKTFLRDRIQVMGHREAQRTDAALLENFQRHEEQERQDHELALLLSRGLSLNNAQARMELPSAEPSTAGPRLSRAPARVELPSAESSTAGLRLSRTPTRVESPSVRAESSTAGLRLSRTPTRVESSSVRAESSTAGLSLTNMFGRFKWSSHTEPIMDSAECASCLNATDDLHKMDNCDHYFCTDCLRTLFTLASKDESLLPVSCCSKPINLELAHRVLKSNDLKNLLRAVLEHQTPNKLYCPVQTCSKFIPLTNISPANGKITCPGCACSICVHCKQRAHGTQDCPEDADAHSFAAFAQEQGWQRCGRCGKYVELEQGCYHMTCACSYQFCYLCGVEWKKCECRQWDEARLITVARERVHIQQPQLRGARLHAEVQEFAQRLRNDHECTHQWRKQNLAARGNCERCRFSMAHYCYNCSTCLINVCYTCRFHRIR